MNEKSVNIWQIGIILFIVLLANKILLLPSLVFKDANFEGLITITILFLIEIGIITLFIFLKRKYKTLSFAQILREKFGNFIKIIIFLLLAIFFVCKILLLYNVTYAFFNELIYKESSPLLYLVCFVPIMTYFVFCPLRTMGRTLQIFFPVILVLAIFCTFLPFVGLNSTPLLFQSSASGVFFSILKHSAAFGDSIILLLFIDKIEYKKGDGKKIYFMALLAILFVFLIFLSFYFSYTYTASFHSYAIFEILGNIKSFGGIGRVDVISLILVMFLTYFQFGIFFKAYTNCFCEVFTRINAKFAVILFDVLFVVLINFVVLNLEKAVMFAENFFPYISMPTIIIVLLFVAISLLRRRKNE